MASTFIFWPAADTNGRDRGASWHGPFSRAAPVRMKKGFLLLNLVLLLGSKGIFIYIEPHSKSLIYTIFVLFFRLWLVETVVLCCRCCLISVLVLTWPWCQSSCLSVYCTVSTLTWHGCIFKQMLMLCWDVTLSSVHGRWRVRTAKRGINIAYEFDLAVTSDCCTVYLTFLFAQGHVEPVYTIIRGHIVSIAPWGRSRRTIEAWESASVRWRGKLSIHFTANGCIWLRADRCLYHWGRSDMLPYAIYVEYWNLTL